MGETIFDRRESGHEPVEAAPKIERERVAVAAKRVTVPSAQDLGPEAGPTDLSQASAPALLRVGENRVKAVYANYQHALTVAIAALKEPPPPSEPSFAVALLVSLVEQLTNLVVGRLGGALVGGLRKAGASDETVEAAKNSFKNVANQAGKTAGQAFEQHAGFTRERRDEDAYASVDPAAKTLLDKFADMQSRRLENARREGLDKLTVIEDAISARNRADLVHLDDALLALEGQDTMDWFERLLVVSWLNFCATLSLGTRDPNAKAQFEGANQVGGIWSGGTGAIAAWRSSHDGFVELRIDVPKDIDGTKGLELADARVTAGGPGAARTLRNRRLSLAQLPVYRRITLATSNSMLDRTPVFVITPEGTLEVDAADEVLAAIGKARPTSLPDFHAQPVDLTAPTAGDLVRCEYAQQGAALVKDWLSRISTEVLQ